VERKADAALLIVAHGSTVNPDSSAPTLAHPAEIRGSEHLCRHKVRLLERGTEFARRNFFVRDPESPS
jgi:hypothetical protein